MNSQKEGDPKKLGLLASVGGIVGLTTAIACGGGEQAATTIATKPLEPTSVPTAFPTNPNSNTELIAPAEELGIVSEIEDFEAIPPSERVGVGKTAPNIDLKRIDGGSSELFDLIGEKPIMLFVAGWVSPNFESIKEQLAIKRYFGEELEVVALAHVSEELESPPEFPLHFVPTEFVQRYTNSAGQFYLINNNGEVVYMDSWIFANEPHALIEGVLEHSRSPVVTNGEFSLPYGKVSEFDPEEMKNILKSEVNNASRSEYITVEEAEYLGVLIDEANLSWKSPNNDQHVPIGLANVGRFVRDRYCENPNEQLFKFLRITATAAHFTYLDAVNKGQAEVVLWDFLRYSFDPNCETLSKSDVSNHRILRDGSWDYGNGVIGPSLRDRQAT